MANDSDTLQFASMVVYEGTIYVSVNIGSRAKNPKDKLDVFLQPLIAELNHLWDVGVNTYDISKKIS